MVRRQARKIAAYPRPAVEARQRPRARARAPARARAAPQALPPTSTTLPHTRPPAKRIAPKVSLSVRIASEARRDRPSGRPDEAERAGRGERGGAWRDIYKKGGGCTHIT
jgi:hypothetical protein